MESLDGVSTCVHSVLQALENAKNVLVEALDSLGQIYFISSTDPNFVQLRWSLVSGPVNASNTFNEDLRSVLWALATITTGCHDTPHFEDAIKNPALRLEDVFVKARRLIIYYSDSLSYYKKLKGQIQENANTKSLTPGPEQSTEIGGSSSLYKRLLLLPSISRLWGWISKISSYSKTSWLRRKRQAKPESVVQDTDFLVLALACQQLEKVYQSLYDVVSSVHDFNQFAYQNTEIMIAWFKPDESKVQDILNSRDSFFINLAKYETTIKMFNDKKPKEGADHRALESGDDIIDITDNDQ